MQEDSNRKILADEIAKGIIETGVEGPFDTVCRSTAGDYPSMGVSCWEGLGGRGDSLLASIEGGSVYIGRSYSDLKKCGELVNLAALLDSGAGREAQQKLLASDCLNYVDALRRVPTLDDTRCLIYAGIWCPTSTYVVTRFLSRALPVYNLRSLKEMRQLFYARYWLAADVGERYRAGYESRAERTYDYVAGLDLSKYGIPEYGYYGL